MMLPEIHLSDFPVLGLLIFLEGILSIDNALVLALLVRHLPDAQRKRALTYGLIGAFVFRFIAVGTANYLMHLNWVKFVGGGYLLWLSSKHLFFTKEDSHSVGTKGRSFWMTVLVVEMTDIAFALDSILAAIALTPKFWLVMTGGMIGVILLRFAAAAFVKVLEKFPGFEKTAYYLVLIIGVKIILEGLHLPGINFHSSSSPAFWIFWGIMVVSILTGFRKQK